MTSSTTAFPHNPGQSIPPSDRNLSPQELKVSRISNILTNTESSKTSLARPGSGPPSIQSVNRVTASMKREDLPRRIKKGQGGGGRIHFDCLCTV
jgi:hypothetical protein